MPNKSLIHFQKWTIIHRNYLSSKMFYSLTPTDSTGTGRRYDDNVKYYEYESQSNAMEDVTGTSETESDNVVDRQDDKATGRDDKAVVRDDKVVVRDDKVVVRDDKVTGRQDEPIRKQATLRQNESPYEDASVSIHDTVLPWVTIFSVATSYSII